MTSVVRPNDEIANAVTHGAGFLLSIAATGHLLQRTNGQSPGLVAACGVYSATLLLVYANSTLSHLFYDLEWRKRFRTLDQASIFLLIAGTYTPFAVMYLSHGWWPLLLAAMWGLAALGVGRVLQVRDLSRTDKYLYGLIGFLPVIGLGELFRHAPLSVIVWIVAGGASYSLGAPFLRLSSSVRYAHAMWHILVMGGSACHYWAILLVLQ